MNSRLLIPLLLLPLACGPKEPAPAASAAPPSTVAVAPSPTGASLVVEVVTIDTAAPSITLREGDVPAGTPKASDLKTGDRTLRVEPSAASSLATVKPGMRIRVTCSAPLPVVADAMAASPAPGAPTTTLAAASGQLGRCDSIVAIAAVAP